MGFGRRGLGGSCPGLGLGLTCEMVWKLFGWGIEGGFGKEGEGGR